MNSTVDQTWSANPTPGGFTDYFNQMSFNSLRITGTSVSVVTPHTRQWYLDNNKVSVDIYVEVFQQLDAAIDFTQFDNWTLNSEYGLTNSADGTVDMILMMWRNIASELPANDNATIERTLHLQPGGEASLGGDYVYPNAPAISVDNGARWIRMYYPGVTPGSLQQGSGITAIQPNSGDLSAGTLWTYARHEFGHWLLGGNEYHTQLGTWGMLNGWGTPSECINSFERYKLG